MAEIQVTDGTTSEDMLRIDLGKNISDIYDTLEGVEISSDDPGILDPEFYRKKLGEVRSSLNIIQTTYAKVMRAKTSAQTRLTSRETRFEILLNSSLENNVEVKEALSADERKARAANRLVDLKNAIRESKNEVEALSNLVKVLGVYSKSLGTISADLKQQAKLVELELQHLPKVTPSKSNNEPSALSAEDAANLFQSRIKDVEDAYSMTPVESSEDLGEDSVEEEGIGEEENILGGMMQSFAEASYDVQASVDAALELPMSSEEESTVDSNESTPATSEESTEVLDLPAEEDFSLPGEDYSPAEMDFDVPGDVAPSSEKASSEKASSEKASSEKELPAAEASSDDDDVITSKEEELPIFDDDQFSLPVSEETLDVGSDNLSLTGLSLGGDTLDFPGLSETLPEVASPSQKPNVSEEDLLSENFEVLSTTETNAQISKEFDTSAPVEAKVVAPVKESAKEEAKSSEVVPEQDPSIDDLLGELLGTT